MQARPGGRHVNSDRVSPGGRFTLHTGVTSSLVWLRRDLRLHDHPPLTAALAAGGPVVLVYCVDPRDLGLAHVGGFPRVGAARWQFLLDSLAELRTACRARGGELVVRVGRPEDELPAIAQAVGAARVFHHPEIASEERAVEQAVARALVPVGARLEACGSHALLHPDDLPFAIPDLPELFTAFRQRIERLTPRAALTTPAALPPLPPGVAPGSIPSLAELGVTAAPPDPRALFSPRGGEAAGLERLTSWAFDLGALGTYKQTRDGLLRADDSSKLGPWLALGCLSPRTVYEAVRRFEAERGASTSTYWLIFELYWRDYFRLVVAKHGDRVFHAGGLVGARIAWRDDPAALEAWCTGHTGFPLVDAAMRELLATGYTSNRARQYVACFLTKHLGLDWRLGAAWFEAQLVDHDVHSNWGNWAYAAGVGNDGRGFRLFNLRKQALEHDTDGAFVRHWIPALARIPADRIHHPDEVPADELAAVGVVLGRDYPRPIIELTAAVERSRVAYEAAMAAVPRKPGQRDRRRPG